MTQSRLLGSDELRGVMLPVGSRLLLLPNSAVAEVIGYQEPNVGSSDPDWMLGSIEWRGRALPVISFELAMGRPQSDLGSQRARIAVLNTLSGNRSLPYIGIYTLGISRLARVTAGNLSEDSEEEPDSSLVLESVKINGQPAWIPDMDKLEELILGSAD